MRVLSLFGSRRSLRRAAPALITMVALAGSASWLSAHDFWLVPGAFPFKEGADIEVLGQSGTRFPASTGATQPARVARAVMIGADGETSIGDLSVRGTSLVLRAKPASAGQRIVALDLVVRSSKQTAASFLSYLKLEGAPAAAAGVESSGALKGVDSVTRTDAKYAKTLVDVGASGPRVYSRSSGQSLEFIPQEDAAAVTAGTTLSLRLAFKGKGVAGVVARAGIAPKDSTAKPDPDLELTSDADGIVKLPVSSTGLWNIRATHVVQTGPNTWETHWATFVFRAGK